VIDEWKVDAKLKASGREEGETTGISDDAHTGRLRTFKIAFVAN
jgi:hypothetical protein